MTADDELALLRQQNAVLLAAVKTYGGWQFWVDYAIKADHLFEYDFDSRGVVTSYRLAERALAEHDRLAAEAAARVAECEAAYQQALATTRALIAEHFPDAVEVVEREETDPDCEERYTVVEVRVISGDLLDRELGFNAAWLARVPAGTMNPLVLLVPVSAAEAGRKAGQ